MLERQSMPDTMTLFRYGSAPATIIFVGYAIAWHGNIFDKKSGLRVIPYAGEGTPAA